MKRTLCLLMAAALLLSGCGGSTTPETETPITEPVVTTEPMTEPTTVPTEPKTFFEEQGVTFWEDFMVTTQLNEERNVQDIIGRTRFLNSAECIISITTDEESWTDYALADTKIEVQIEQYTLEELDEACRDNRFDAKIITNASESLYNAFAEDDSNLTKEEWLTEYQDYKVVHCQLLRTVLLDKSIRESLAKRYKESVKWKCYVRAKCQKTYLLNGLDGKVYSLYGDNPSQGDSESFLITTKTGEKMMAIAADLSYEFQDSVKANDWLLLEHFFVMVPQDMNDFAFVVPSVNQERTMEEFESESCVENDVCELREEKYADYTKDRGHMKYYFLSPYCY